MRPILGSFLHLLLISLQSAGELLKKVDFVHYTKGFQLTGPIAIIIIYTIIYLGSFFGSYAIAIILMTLLVRLMLLNLTIALIKTMKLNQYVAPLAKEIQKRYRHDKALQNRKLMLLYQYLHFNPLSGCMAMPIQVIILFGVYRALYDPVFLGQTFWGIQMLFPMNLYFAARFGAAGDFTSRVFDYINTHGISWQVIQWSISSGGKIYKWAIYWPSLLLVIFYILTSLLMQKVMRKSSQPDPAIRDVFADPKAIAKGKDKSQEFADAMQRQMGLTNIMLVFFAFIVSAGALLYFIVQNVLMMIEYTLIPRSFKLAYSPAELKGIMEAIEKETPLAAHPSGTSSSQEKVSEAELEQTEAQEIVSLRKPFQKKK